MSVLSVLKSIDGRKTMTVSHRNGEVTVSLFDDDGHHSASFECVETDSMVQSLIDARQDIYGGRK